MVPIREYIEIRQSVSLLFVVATLNVMLTCVVETLL